MYTDKVDNFLYRLLENYPRYVEDVIKAAEKVGYTKAQMRQAKMNIGAVTIRMGTIEDAHWVWTLPRFTHITLTKDPEPIDYS
jgi:hypothetical protein